MDFLMEHEHHHMPHDFEHLKIAMAQYYASLLTKLKDHIDDHNVHVTLEEKERWNKKADGLSLEELELKLLKKANISDIPTLISELKNDVPYLTAESLNAKLNALDFVTWADLKYKDYITADEVNRLIHNIVIDPSNINLYDYVKKNELATINGMKLYEGGNIVVRGGSGGDTDLSDYVKKGSFLGKINNVDLYQGNSIIISGGSSSDSSSYTLPVATASTLGGIKLGYSGPNKTYPVQLDSNNRAFVSVPWLDPTSNPQTPKYTVYHYESAFIAVEEGVIPPLPTNGIASVDKGWTLNSAPNNTNGSLVIWMTQRTVDNLNSYDSWQGPWRISGPGGSNGEDGNSIDWIYCLSTSEDLSLLVSHPDTWAIEQNDTHSNVIKNPTTKVTTGWTDNPQGIDSSYKYEWASFRVKTNDSWGKFSVPILWSAYGKSGMDGDGIEYIFYTHNGTGNPTWNANNNPANWTTDANFQNREYIRTGTGWSDDPDDLTTLPGGSKIYVSIRRKYSDSTNQSEDPDAYWHAYSQPSLWSSKGIDGAVNGVQISVSNPTIPVSFDETGKNVAFNETSIITAWNGNQQLTIKSIAVDSIKSGNNSVSGLNVTSSPSGSSSTKTVTLSAQAGQFIVKDVNINVNLKVTVTYNGADVIQNVSINVFGIKIGEDGATYNLVLDNYQIMLKKDGTSFVPSTITPTVSVVKGLSEITSWTASSLSKQTGDAVQKQLKIEYKMGNASNWTSMDTNSIIPSPNSFNSYPDYIQFRLRYNNVTVDSAQVLVLDKVDVPAPAATYSVIPINNTLVKNSTTNTISGSLTFTIDKTQFDQNQSKYVTEHINPSKIYIKCGSRDGYDFNGSTLIQNVQDGEKRLTRSSSNNVYTIVIENASCSNNDCYAVIQAKDNAGWVLAGIVIPIAIPGKSAEQQSLIGKVIRTRVWSKFEVEPAYNDGETVEDGIQYVDVVAFGDQWYRCINSNLANRATIYDSESRKYSHNNIPSVNTGNNGWRLLNNYGDGFFNFIKANAALIDNLTSHEVVITDSNNNVVAGMTSGQYIPSEFGNNIENTDGIRIWAGSFSNGNIASAPFTIDSNGNIKAQGLFKHKKVTIDLSDKDTQDKLINSPSGSFYYYDIENLNGSVIEIKNAASLYIDNELKDFQFILPGVPVVSRAELLTHTAEEYLGITIWIHNVSSDHSAPIFVKGDYRLKRNNTYNEIEALTDSISLIDTATGRTLPGSPTYSGWMKCVCTIVDGNPAWVLAVEDTFGNNDLY